MNKICAVCKEGKNPTKCEICGFSDNGVISREFVNVEDANYWLETVVKPYRIQWEASKREAELLAQLETSKQNEIRLSSELEQIKNNLTISENIHSESDNFFTDPRDGQKYRTVKIGNQIWMAENLNYKIGKCWAYDNGENNRQKYGLLYNWETAMEACPAGWHLSTRDDWEELIRIAGGIKEAGKNLKSKTGWDDNGNGTDKFGFSALPGGYRSTHGRFGQVGRYGRWWSVRGGYAHYWYMDWGFEYADGLWSYGKDEIIGYSVRCVKDV